LLQEIEVVGQHLHGLQLSEFRPVAEQFHGASFAGTSTSLRSESFLGIIEMLLRKGEKEYDNSSRSVIDSRRA
jgi:hypothetical protein